MADRIKVLYIAGSGRNGSTLLARLLGELDGFVNVGEAARYLFNTRMRSRNLLCGCGQQVQECVFWKNLVSIVDKDILRFATQIASARRLPILMFSSAYRHHNHGAWDRLLSLYEEMYNSIASQENCRVVIDASKHPTNAYILSQVPMIDVYILHLIRDVRGVLSSWSKPKGYLKRLPFLRVVAQWLSYNLFAELLRLSGVPYLRITYEDFTRRPGRVLDQIIEFVGEPGLNAGSLLEGNRARLVSQQHSLAGNPDKLTQKQVIYIQERKWSLPLWKNLWAVGVTWPLLVRYGYLRIR